MRRLSLLFAGGLLWLFLAAIPALADGGPHLSLVNSGSSSLTADSCAGCHRAHTAQGEYLLAAQSEEALCLSCHGSAGTGSTVDVEFGVQYVPVTGRAATTTYALTGINVGLGTLATTPDSNFMAGQSVQIAGLVGIPNGVYSVAASPAPDANSFKLVGVMPTALTGTPTVSVTNPAGVVLGALRDGGFLKARIGASSPSRLAYPRAYADAPFNTTFAMSTKPKVPVGASEPVTSAHIDLADPLNLTNGIADKGRMWGSGTTGTGSSPVELSCVECHNPHGNGNYRILKPVPGTDADPLGAPVTISVKATYLIAKTIVTTGQHALVVNDAVTLTGVGGLTGTYYVSTVVNGFTFQVSTTLGGAAVAPSNGGAAGTVVRPTIQVADSPVDPDGDLSYPVKNYTVIETKGSQGVNATFLLYARDVVATGGTSVAARLPVSITTVTAVTSGGVTTNYLQTSAAHGLAVGDLVTIASTPGGVAAGTYTVGAVRSSGTVYDQFTLIGQTPGPAGATSGTVARNAIAGDYTAIGGDYFRRTVPWSPSLVNPTCSNLIVSSTNSQYCGTMNDAPNGRPAAITSGTGRPSSLVGQQAFLDQMSTWCATCHSRYYSSTNENSGTEPVLSALNDIGIGQTTAAGVISPVAYTVGNSFGIPSYGDRVTFSGAGATLNANPVGGWYVIASSSGTFSVSDTFAGAAVGLSNAGPTVYPANLGTYTKVYQSSNSSWGYPRDDATYKFQHSTSSNRACTVCHLAHGSNAVMTGQNGTTFSRDETYPDGSAGTLSSRLLKVDNRGTCQMCHDPTGTITEGTMLGLDYNLSTPLVIDGPPVP